MVSKFSVEKIFIYFTLIGFFVPGENRKMLFFILLFLGYLFFDNFQIKISKKIAIPILIYLGTTCLSHVFRVHSQTLRDIAYFLTTFLIPGYILLKCVKNKKAIDETIEFILVIFSVYAGLCIIEGFTQFNIFDVITGRQLELLGANTYRLGIYRAHGYCGVSINNGAILFMVWMLASYKFYNCFKIKYLIPFVIIGVSVFLNLSRMVILVAIFAQVIILLQLKKTRLMYFVFSVLLLWIVVSFLFPEKVQMLYNQVATIFIPLIEEFFGTTGRNNGVYVGGSGHRFALWNWVYSATKDSLLFGHGFDSVFRYPYYSNGYLCFKLSIEIHWLYLLYHSGIVGVCGFICYQVFCLVNMFKERNISMNEKEKPSFGYIFLLMSAGYFMVLFSCAGFEDLDWYYMLFFIFLSGKNVLSFDDKVGEI